MLQTLNMDYVFTTLAGAQGTESYWIPEIMESAIQIQHHHNQCMMHVTLIIYYEST